MFALNSAALYNDIWVYLFSVFAVSDILSSPAASRAAPARASPAAARRPRAGRASKLDRPLRAVQMYTY